MKRGNNLPPAAMGASTLIILIGVFIILYMLLIPSDLRNELLNITSEDEGGEFARENVREGKTLLSESPGKVFAFEEEKIVKELASFDLFSRVEKETITLANSLSISKGLFSDKSKTLFFNLDDLNVDDINLFFFVKRGSGNLLVELNDNIIYEGKIGYSDLPIRLPNSFLMKSNKLKFSVSGIFGGSYDLSMINLEKITLVENKKVTRTFIISSFEEPKITKATLSYFINCLDLLKQGRLTIILNNKLIVDGFAVCDVSEQNFEINKKDLILGNNLLEFSINDGDYRFDDIEIEVEVEEAMFPKYNFDIDDDDFDRIIGICDDEKVDECIDECDKDCDTTECFRECEEDCAKDCDKTDIFLRMNFGDRDDRKKATIVVNEFEFDMNTLDDEFEREINRYVRRGNNVIKIIPKTNFEIDNLRVFLSE